MGGEDEASTHGDARMAMHAWRCTHHACTASFTQNKHQGIFRNADAAYVLAYSVIMLNTDRHNTGVRGGREGTWGGERRCGRQPGGWVEGERERPCKPTGTSLTPPLFLESPPTNLAQHASGVQVKNKMSLESFRRNLRGVNENTDFPEEFLNEIYYSIIKVRV